MSGYRARGIPKTTPSLATCVGQRRQHWLWLGLVAALCLATPQRVVAQLTAEDIAALRAQGAREGWTFEVGPSEATQYPLEQLCGLIVPPDWEREVEIEHLSVTRTLPASFDWRYPSSDPNRPVGVTPIRNQGGCGSCWAFAAIGAMESAIKISDRMDVDLSEQWLVSCTRAGSCSGGWHYTAFDYLKCNGARDHCNHSGAVLEQHFPYVAWDAPCGCPYPHPYCLTSWSGIGSSTNEIKQAIFDRGPIATTVYVNSAFQAYKTGVFNSCASGNVNHAVVLVGWNDSQQCWIMRNSWGPSWGEGGYMRIRYGCSSIGYASAYVTYTLVDCNGNGIPDRRECVLGETADCNRNLVPDSCELAEGSQTDCNGNGRLDMCDIDLGQSPDCNKNRLPDECELALHDCDQNAIPDDCDISEGRKRDCNGNAVPDECELASGAAMDCNANGIPDGCDLLPDFRARSAKLTPLGTGYVHTYVVNPAPLALTDVRLTFRAAGDLNFADECVDVYLNGTWVGRVFTGSYLDCMPAEEELLVSAAAFNAAAWGGAVTIALVPSEDVSPGHCLQSFISVSVAYTRTPASRDCNSNGLPDECDIAQGRSQDLNGDGIPDECPAIGCPGDANCDGVVSWRDIDYFVTAMGNNYAAWAARFPGVPPCDFLAGCDVNRDGAVSWRDVSPFVAVMSTSCAR